MIWTQLRLLSDGRVLLGVRTNDQVVLYAAPPDVAGPWTRLTAHPTAGSDFVLTESGALVAERDDKIWRYEIGRGDWREVSFADSLAGTPGTTPGTTAGMTAGTAAGTGPPDVVRTWWRDGRLQLLPENGQWRGLLGDADGRTTPTAPFAAPNRLHIRSVAPAPSPGAAADLRLTDDADRRAWLWTDPQQPPRPLPDDPFGWPTELAAIDDDRILGVNAGRGYGGGASLQILSLADQPVEGGACDGLMTYLARVFGQAPPPRAMIPYVDPALFYETWDQREDEAESQGFVPPGCRDAVRGRRAPALTALLRGWAQGRDVARIRTGRLWSCAIQDPEQLSSVPQWMADVRWPSVRRVCATQLTAWPGAERERRAAASSYVREGRDGWEVDYAVVKAVEDDGAPTELREQLVPVLREAARRHARGFDRLRKSVCKDADCAPAERKQACTETNAEDEGAWRSGRQHAHRLLWAGITTAVVAGAVAGTYATRDSDTGLGLATGAGVIGGATLGISLGALASYGALDHIRSRGKASPPS